MVDEARVQFGMSSPPSLRSEIPAADRSQPRISGMSTNGLISFPHNNIMPSSVTKVTKQIKKKKPGKIGALHENSRDAKRLRRANARDDKLNRVATVRARKVTPFRALFSGSQKTSSVH